MTSHGTEFHAPSAAHRLLILNTVFTWLNAAATIIHLCKMTASTIQVRHLLQCTTAAILKPLKLYSAKFYLYIIAWYPISYVDTSFLSKCTPLQVPP